MEQLGEEVNDLSVMEENEISNAVMKATGNGDSKLKPDIIWSHMSSMKRPDGQKRFPKLSRITFLVLTILHSNAEERVFSMVRQNKTSFRPNLDEQETLESIMTIKMEIGNQPLPKGGILKFPPSVLGDAKK